MIENESSYPINIGDDSVVLAEKRRLEEQDEFLTEWIKPLLPASFRPDKSYKILDIATGTGGWPSQVAREFPRVHIVGIDISERMLERAQGRAESWKLDKRLTFQEGNILKKLEFEDNSFDLVHGRLLQASMQDEESWIRLMKECYRITKPGGYIKITESDALSVANAPNFHKLIRYIYRAMWNAKKCFAETEPALTAMLSKFMMEAGYINIEDYACPLNFSVGMPLHHRIVSDFRAAHEMGRPFTVKYAGISNEEYLDVYEKTQEEMKKVRGMWYFTSTEGQKPLA